MSSETVDAIRRALADRYRLEEELGRGGMAIVYRGVDLRHGRPVAVKILRDEIAQAVGEERFSREIAVAAKLQHPHIVPVYDSGEAAGRLFLVMPLLEGETLATRMSRERQLPIKTAVRIAKDVADALAYAHSHGVIHRDIKPGNIMLAGDAALVMDFGIARVLADPADQRRLTESGIAIGTPTYMSPEQAGGEQGLDGRSDIYALGCVLYEMLAGEPPFHGPSAQAVLARHLRDIPPSIRVVRPTVPPRLEEAVFRALQKVPADRFATAHALAEELPLAETASVEAPTLARRRWLPIILVAAAIALAVGALRFALMDDTPLDQNRVVVFPLRGQVESAQGAGLGEGIATLVGYALEGTEPLRWLDGWDRLAPDERADIGRVPRARLRAISRGQRAAFYIDGSVIQTHDSTVVVLRLNDVAADSTVTRVGATGRSDDSSYTEIGLRAAAALLPALVDPSRSIEFTAFAGRNLAAIANWLQGDLAYRRSNFSDALTHFERALDQDSALAVAALGGAQAASWKSRLADAERLADAAVANERLLPRRQRQFAHGLRFYLAGSPDSAIGRLRLALAEEPQWSEAWMVLSEVYSHLLPATTDFDSLALAALRQAAAADSSFTPPFVQLAEHALLHGEADSARALVDRFQSVNPDPELMYHLRFMLECARRGSATMDWERATGSHVFEVLTAAVRLAHGPTLRDCAEGAFRAVLAADAASPSQRWGALLGLQSLLGSRGRWDAVQELLISETARPLGGPYLLLLDVAAGAPFGGQADSVAEGLRPSLPRLGTPTLWLFGLWSAARSRLGDLAAARDAAAQRAHETQSRRDRLIADILTAHWLLLTGDSARAIPRLEQLRPNARRDDLLWQPWESLAPERMLLAEIDLAQGRLWDAYRTAAFLDHPQPIVYLMFQPRSLRVRAEAATLLNRTDLVRLHESQLAALQSSR